MLLPWTVRHALGLGRHLLQHLLPTSMRFIGIPLFILLIDIHLHIYEVLAAQQPVFLAGPFWLFLLIKEGFYGFLLDL